MRLKVFSLAAVAAVAAMALVASSAMATGSTSMCKVNETPCAAGNQVKSLHMVAGTSVLKTSILTVLCLSSLAQVPITTTLGNPLKTGALTSLTWENCGSNAAHNNCTVTNLKLPTFDVLRTAAGLGEATALGAEVLVLCGESLHCVYGGAAVTGFKVEGALHTAGAGHGMFTASELKVPKVSGFLCPAESKWTALYEPLEHVFLST